MSALDGDRYLSIHLHLWPMEHPSTPSWPTWVTRLPSPPSHACSPTSCPDISQGRKGGRTCFQKPHLGFEHGDGLQHSPVTLSLLLELVDQLLLGYQCLFCLLQLLRQLIQLPL